MKTRSDLFVWDLTADDLMHALPSVVWGRGGNHPIWYNDEEVLMNLREEKNGPFKFTVFRNYSEGHNIVARDCAGSGHPTRLSSKNRIITDSYFFHRVQRLHLVDYSSGHATKYDLARFRYNYNLTGINRCDLHPRVNRAGDLVCFDSTMEGTRSMYVIDIRRFLESNQIRSTLELR